MPLGGLLPYGPGMQNRQTNRQQDILRLIGLGVPPAEAESMADDPQSMVDLLDRITKPTPGYAAAKTLQGNGAPFIGDVSRAITGKIPEPTGSTRELIETQLTKKKDLARSPAAYSLPGADKVGPARLLGLTPQPEPDGPMPYGPKKRAMMGNLPEDAPKNITGLLQGMLTQLPPDMRNQGMNQQRARELQGIVRSQPELRNYLRDELGMMDPTQFGQWQSAVPGGPSANGLARINRRDKPSIRFKPEEEALMAKGATPDDIMAQRRMAYHERRKDELLRRKLIRKDQFKRKQGLGTMMADIENNANKSALGMVDPVKAGLSAKQRALKGGATMQEANYIGRMAIEAALKHDSEVQKSRRDLDLLKDPDIQRQSLLKDARAMVREAAANDQDLTFDDAMKRLQASPASKLPSQTSSIAESTNALDRLAKDKTIKGLGISGMSAQEIGQLILKRRTQNKPLGDADLAKIKSYITNKAELDPEFFPKVYSPTGISRSPAWRKALDAILESKGNYGEAVSEKIKPPTAKSWWQTYLDGQRSQIDVYENIY